ncbi:MAG: hypothetical protein NZ580_06910, partial [Bacteroidia bacterium]|nr:hypothetical protein [Bacteroidia bacterium]
MWRISLLIGLMLGQRSLQMGARLMVSQSRLLSPTDKQATLLGFDRTYRSGLTGFFSWGLSPYVATGLELGYYGAGQRFYGTGVNGQPYRAEVRLHYLRAGLALQPQYAREWWGFWGSISPSVAFLTQSEFEIQGDSLPVGNLFMPQVIQGTLAYLEQSTNPDDRLMLMKMYRRAVPVISVAGGLRVRLAEGVWVLGLIFYERSLRDIEAKNYRISPQSPLIYHPQRRVVYYELSGFQVGLQYEVPLP